MATWLQSLQTKTPQEGFELAITLARKGVAYTQPSAEVRDRLRADYAGNADSLTAASQVVAIHFQTVAAANNYWMDCGRAGKPHCCHEPLDACHAAPGSGFDLMRARKEAGIRLLVLFLFMFFLLIKQLLMLK